MKQILRINKSQFRNFSSEIAEEKLELKALIDTILRKKKWKNQYSLQGRVEIKIPELIYNSDKRTTCKYNI